MDLIGQKETFSLLNSRVLNLFDPNLEQFLGLVEGFIRPVFQQPDGKGQVGGPILEHLSGHQVFVHGALS